jgi:uncharacterized protein YjbJ (UPF0337 family)
LGVNPARPEPAPVNNGWFLFAINRTNPGLKGFFHTLKVTGSSSRARSRNGKLSDDDLDRIAGKRDQLEGTIQERYGLEKDRAKADVDAWCNRQT